MKVTFKLSFEQKEHVDSIYCDNQGFLCSLKDGYVFRENGLGFICCCSFLDLSNALCQIERS